MRDSNQQVQKVKIGITDEIQIGDFRFQKVRSLVSEKKFLYCLDYFLLGSDIINQLNWEINFEAMRIRVSPQPFPAE